MLFATRTCIGRLALGDIGHHFPDTSAQYKGIDSKILLKEVVKLVKQEGYSISNVDSSLCLERPKINPYIAQMRETLALVMGLQMEDISIKATTNEKMGYVGREKRRCMCIRQRFDLQISPVLKHFHGAAKAVLIVAATEAEIAPTLQSFSGKTNINDRLNTHAFRNLRIDVLVTGVGMLSHSLPSY